MQKSATKRMFDIAAESQRIQNALAQMKATQQPGEALGKGNKTQVLQTQITEIQSLVSAGYTVRQIAAAMSNDTFGILPKSITQLLNRRQASKPMRVKPKGNREGLVPAHKEANSAATAAPYSKQVTEIGDVE